ncbi:galactoside 2-alpha-L-fucosyltransferase 3-like isoform X1 [Stegodyphus dumicola]|uniref:galactoside 2-alpha-L-fucosyltransferase 3-like isoform X1 n=1 Tax=Stegodyphus dumicola TaxID=202533 RepID=UPI0015ADC25E|nr:galactoside 2-alpha-L-fucosyltransferase 3-like isoform X1 [Stegodyphus dumicola]
MKQIFKNVIFFIIVLNIVVLLIIQWPNLLLSPEEALEPLTIHVNRGRLGNQMFTYATLYGLGRLNRRHVRLMPQNYNALKSYFKLRHSQVNEFTFKEKHPWPIGSWLQPHDSHIPNTTNIVKGRLYPTSFTFFHHVQDEIRDIFQFQDTIRHYAQNVLRHVKRLRPWTEVYIGVHVRRGDYLSKSKGGWLRAFEGREVDIEYFRKAVDYFRRKYSNLTFIAVSDDRQWCKKYLPQFHILTLPFSPSPAHDLAIMAECNHTIITYGTFSFWSGYLAGGEVIYFSNFVNPKRRSNFPEEKMYPPKWIGISTTPKGFWDSYKNPFLDHDGNNVSVSKEIIL